MPCVPLRLASSHRFIFHLVAYPPRPSRSSHPYHLSHRHRPALLDETSDEQAKRRAWRVIGNGKAERHDIRHLDDNANAPPRPPYSPYEPHDAQTPTRNTPTGKRPIHEPHNAPDGQYGTTNGTRQRDASACRHDDETLRRNAACLLTDTTTERRTPRRILLPAPRHDNTGREAGRWKREAKRDDGRDEKNGPPIEKKGGPKTVRGMRLNEKIATRHRYRNHPVNGENQEDENENTHTAPASS